MDIKAGSIIKYIFILAIIVVIVCISIFMFIVIMLGGGLGDMKSKDKIFSYVNKNYELLENFPYDEFQEIKTNEYKKEKFIKEYLGNGTIVKSIYAYNENILQYYCGGKGNVGGSTYTGFYFSKDNTPYAMEFNGCDLKEIKTDVFEWKNADGSHRIYTEKIRDNWYYYILEWY